MAKFNHQPFNDWLLSGEALSPDDARSLQEHLSQCGECQVLAEALQGIERDLRHAPQHEPAPGFVNRWQARLEIDRLRHSRRQALWMMLFSLGGAMALFTMLAIQVAPLLRSPKPFLLAYAYEIVSAFSFMSVIGDALLTVVRTIVELIPPTQWAAIMMALACLGTVWVVTLHRLTSTRRVNL